MTARHRIRTGVRSPYRQGSTGDATILLLFHMDGINGGVSFLDSSALARVVTPNGNVQTSTTVKKFGTASALFDGVDDYLTTPNTVDLRFGANAPFTIDCWAKLSAIYAMFAHLGVTNGRWVFLCSNTGKLIFYVAPGFEGTVVAVSAADVPLNTLTHLAVTRSAAGAVTLYIDGVVDGTGTYSGALNFASGDFRCGVDDASVGDINGYVDELRICNVDKYGGVGFTPPTVAYV